MGNALRTLVCGAIVGALGCGKTSSDEPPAPTTIFAHSISSLFQITPSTGEVTELGTFVDASSGGPISSGMYDIALNKDGLMYGVSVDGFYRIDYRAKPSPKCALLATPTDAYNALAFAAPGTVDPSNEVLVAVSPAGKVVRIDLAPDGTKATFRSLGLYGGVWNSSGDLASVPNGALYATVIDPAGGDDHLATVDPKTGAANDVGALGLKQVWGLAYADGTLYGFTQAGTVHRIDPKTAKATAVPLKSTILGGFYGAGP